MNLSMDDLYTNMTMTDTPVKFDPDARQVVSWHTFMKIARYFELVVNPIVGIIGLAGNIISGVVVYRSGLHKPSNIFLFGLAVVDSLVLIGSFNIPMLLFYHLQPNKHVYGGWEFSRTAVIVLFYFTISIFNIESLGTRLSTYFTILITLERLIAIFFPLKFSTIVTKKKAWVAMAIVLLFWLPWYVFHWWWWKYQYAWDKDQLVYIGYFIVNDIVRSKEFNVAKFDDTVMKHLGNTVPLAIVTVGSVIIALQVRITQRRRQKMMSSSSKQGSTSRTTITLLMVCLVYSFLRLTALLQYVSIFDFYSPVWSNVAWIYQRVYICLVRINSACNFFIYVALNNKFRSKLKAVFPFSLFADQNKTRKNEK